MERRPEQRREVLEGNLGVDPLEPRSERSQVSVRVVRLGPRQERLLAELGERRRVGALATVEVAQDLPHAARLQLREYAVQVGRLLLPELEFLQRPRVVRRLALLLLLLLLPLRRRRRG